jgi:hypothetical protein
MKFNISRPPAYRGNTKEYLERLSSWLYILSEGLNVALSNLGEENFSADGREKLFLNKEEKDGNV